MVHVPPNVCQNGVDFLRRLAGKKKKLYDSSHLDVVEIACRLTCFLSASVTRKDLQFDT